MALFPFHFHGPTAVPVIDGPALWGGQETLFHDMPGDFDVLIPDPGTGLFHHLMNLFVTALKSHPFNDIKGSLFDFPDLVVGEDSHAHGPGLDV
jgi:hypothetical protein